MIELYVLDFTKINNLKYINHSLNTKILKIVPDNLSVNKKYYPIYTEFINIMRNNEEYNSIVKDYYKKIDLSFFYYFVI